LEFVAKAFKAGDLAYGVADAILWATEEDWKGTPPAATAKDMEDFVAVDYELEALVLQRLAEVRHSRLSEERVQRILSRANPEFKKILHITRGVPLLRNPSHVPNGSGQWPNRSRMSRKACALIKKMFHDGIHSLRLAIYLKAPVVRLCVRNATVSAGSWAMASAKRRGRFITNCSFAGKGNTLLNTPVVKSACNDLWGLTVVGDY
jgi:hypothetical protein